MHDYLIWVDAATPANTIHEPNVDSMLVQRLRRWPNIGPTLGLGIVFTGTWCVTGMIFYLNTSFLTTAFCLFFSLLRGEAWM